MEDSDNTVPPYMEQTFQTSENGVYGEMFPTVVTNQEGGEEGEQGSDVGGEDGGGALQDSIPNQVEVETEVCLSPYIYIICCQNSLILLSLY